jgi:HrpA-like RNA helicase
MNNDLPIVKALPELKDALRSGRRAVLSPPPGTGKTTLGIRVNLRKSHRV